MALEQVATEMAENCFSAEFVHQRSLPEGRRIDSDKRAERTTPKRSKANAFLSKREKYSQKEKEKDKKHKNR